MCDMSMYMGMFQNKGAPKSCFLDKKSWLGAPFLYTYI